MSGSMSATDRLLTVAEVAGWLQVKARTIYQWVHEGYIPVVKLGSLVRFDRTSVRDWLGKRAVTGRASRRLELDVG